MTLQIYSDYNLPVLPKDLTWEMMLYFYEPNIDSLIKIQKQSREM